MMTMVIKFTPCAHTASTQLCGCGLSEPFKKRKKYINMCETNRNFANAFALCVCARVLCCLLARHRQEIKAPRARAKCSFQKPFHCNFLRHIRRCNGAEHGRAAAMIIFYLPRIGNLRYTIVGSGSALWPTVVCNCMNNTNLCEPLLKTGAAE